MLLDDVKTRLEWLGYTIKDGDDWLLKFIVSKVENHIKNNCNINAVPKGLREIAVDMVCGEFLSGKKAMNQLPELELEAIVKTVQDGDTTVTFTGETSAEQKFDSFMTKMMNPDQSCFIRYRKLVW